MPLSAKRPKYNSEKAVEFMRGLLSPPFERAQRKLEPVLLVAQIGFTVLLSWLWLNNKAGVAFMIVASLWIIALAELVAAPRKVREWLLLPDNQYQRLLERDALKSILLGGLARRSTVGLICAGALTLILRKLA